MSEERKKFLERLLFNSAPKTPVQEAYERQLALKNNEVFDRRVEETFVEIANEIIEEYPNIRMEAPRLRVKSDNSLRGKIDKLEIDRLCKLFIIGDLEFKDEQRLVALLKDRLLVENENDEVKHQNIIKDVFYSDIKNLDNIDDFMQDRNYSDNTKMALLRIYKTRLDNSVLQQEQKDEINNHLEENYGETAAIRENYPERNILHWECIEKMLAYKDEIKQLHKPLDFLKAKDLRGFKFIISDIPDDFVTDNEKLKELLENKKNAPEDEKSKWKDLCCIELGREIAEKIVSNEKLLKKINVCLIPNGYKHKKKTNGYIADHIKMCYRDHPEFIFEMQFRTMYREELSRANGKAAHDKRVGKKRIFPNISNKEKFMNEVEKRLPKYRILLKKDGKFALRRCTSLENMMQYYMGYVPLDSIEFHKAYEYLKDEELNKDRDLA